MIWCASGKRAISIEWIWSETLIGLDCIGADLHLNQFSMFHPNGGGQWQPEFSRTVVKTKKVSVFQKKLKMPRPWLSNALLG